MYLYWAIVMPSHKEGSEAEKRERERYDGAWGTYTVIE